MKNKHIHSSAKSLVLGLVAALALTVGNSAQAAIFINIAESGSDVVVTTSGSILLGDETPHAQNQSVFAAMLPGAGLLETGAGGLMDTFEILDAGGPSAFGTGTIHFATSSTGDMFSLRPTATTPVIAVSTSYISGDSISSTATYANKSFASLGLTPGSSFVWTTTAGTSNIQKDSITLNVVPEPSSLALLGLSSLGLLVRRRR